MSFDESERLATNPMNDLLATDERIIAVGGFQENSGVIVTSESGSHWVLKDIPLGQGLWAICKGHDKLITVGSKGTVLESQNGESWNVAAQLDGEHWLFDVTFGRGLYVTGGVSGLYRSVDAQVWERTHTDSNIYGLAYAEDQFVAVGYEGRVFVSPDGGVWTPRASQTRFMLRSVAYGKGIWIAVGGEGRHEMIISYDSEFWFRSSSGSNAQLMDIVFANGTFVLVGGTDYDPTTRTWKTGTIEYSTDGMNWVTYFIEGGPMLSAVAARKDGWVVSGENGYVGSVSRTPAGLELVDLLDGKVTGTANSISPEREFTIPIVKIEPTETGALIRWQSTSGFIYSVRRSYDLQTWEDTGISYDGDGSELHHTEAFSADTKAIFFRLEIRHRAPDGNQR